MKLIKQLIQTLYKRFDTTPCKCSEIPLSDYPTAREGRLIQLLNGHWVSVSSLPYMAPELFACSHVKAR